MRWPLRRCSRLCQTLFVALRQAPHIEGVTSVGIQDRAEAVRRCPLHNRVARGGARDIVDGPQEHQCGDACGRPRPRPSAIRIVHRRLREGRRSLRHGDQCGEDTAAAIRPADDRYPAGINAGLSACPDCGFDDVRGDFGLRHMGAIVHAPPADGVHEHDEVPRSPQFGRAFVVKVDAVGRDEAGATGHEQNRGMWRVARWRQHAVWLRRGYCASRKQQH